MARHERSAGVIVYRIDSVDPNTRLYLLLDYGAYWDYPKGHLETGEDDRTAALRELEEETGIVDGRLRSDFAREIVYYFKHPKRGLIRKEVVFFIGQTVTKDVRLSDEHVGFAFLPFEQAMARLKYANAKDVLSHAHAFLNEVEPST